MQITRVSKLSQQKRTLDLPVTSRQLARWRKGEPIEQVFNHLTPAEREFLSTGIVKSEWGAFSEG
jgi:hypothetical protein